MMSKGLFISFEGADGSGKSYKNEETIPAGEFTEDMTLYAQWATAVVFDGNEATSGSMAPQTFTIVNPPETIKLNKNN